MRFMLKPGKHFSEIFRSSTAFAIRNASSPEEALSLYKARLHRLRPEDFTFEGFAAVFAIKANKRSPHLFHAHILKTGLFAEVHVATALLHSYSLQWVSDAQQLFDEIPNRTVVTSNIMITSYARNRKIAAARSLFDSMPERDIASWCAMVGGYMDNGNRLQGISLFRDMMNIGELKPDPMILVTLLAGCSSTGAMGLIGRSVHAYVVKDGMEITVQLGTSLIDIYAKSGSLLNAFKVFERVPERNVMHWTAMISGLAFNGHGEDAVSFFEAMIIDAVRPNDITFTSVLNACCHSGLVEEGEKYFISMVEEFGIQPSVHHYGCMVDLFAKVGRLEDAYKVIQNMKVEPNIVIWTSLLSSCKKYKNFEIAEKAIEKALDMATPEDNGGLYALVSDLYALESKWDDVERMRKLMDEEHVKKNREQVSYELVNAQELCSVYQLEFCQIRYNSNHTMVPHTFLLMNHLHK